MQGPLSGLRIIEMEGLGPAPFCGMMLADHGAEVIQVCRISAPNESRTPNPVLNRSRKTIAIDVKSARGLEVMRDLVGSADGLIEGFRPGVMERLGLGPMELLAQNPRLVYGRMTGWGQTGPYADMAGHDINYIALSGVLDLLGRADQKPTPPINLLGDFGGGGMMLAFGMLAAIVSAEKSGVGQVVDCSMVEGTAVLSSMIWGFRAQGRWSAPRGCNFLDTGAHFYDSYECADGRYIVIGAIEPQFYAELRRLIGIDRDASFDQQKDPMAWAALKEKLTQLFKTRTRDDWTSLLQGSDACFAPVVSLDEAPHHPHNEARQSFVAVDNLWQPAPAPRYSVSQTRTPTMPRHVAAEGDGVLRSLGYEQRCIDDLRLDGVLG